MSFFNEMIWTPHIIDFQNGYYLFDLQINQELQGITQSKDARLPSKCLKERQP